jgi:hypothetical protein
MASVVIKRWGHCDELHVAYLRITPYIDQANLYNAIDLNSLHGNTQTWLPSVAS